MGLVSKADQRQPGGTSIKKMTQVRPDPAQAANANMWPLRLLVHVSVETCKSVGQERQS